MMANGSFLDEKGGLLQRLGEILTRDHASRLNPYIKWMRRPATVLATAAVTALLCGLYLHPRALILGAGLAAVLAAGVAWPWLSVVGLTGELSFEASRVREGRPTTTRLAIRNRAPWGAWGLAIRDASGTSLETASGLAFAPGFRTTEAMWDVVFDRRGEYPEVSPRIVCGFPFGVREASRPLAATGRLIVWPATFPVGPIPEAAGVRESDGTALRDRAGSTGDLVGVRPYRSGDSIRRVHWPQSARHGTLIVCELESRATPEVQIVLDVHPDAHAGSGTDGSLEWSVRVAASFAEDWISQGAEVEVVHGGTSTVASGRSMSIRRALVLDALARLKPDAGQTLAEVLGGPSCSRRASGLRVVVSTDRSERPVSSRAGGGPAERFVVLSAKAFADGNRVGCTPPNPLPWIWIDGPEDVARQIRRGWKEVGVESRCG
jgi:uncharacterized protein (DUF58 family)